MSIVSQQYDTPYEDTKLIFFSICTSDLLSLPTTDNPISLNNPVPLNAQTANKGGAIRDMKNCKRTVKLIKTAKNPNVNLQNSKQSSNENNDGDGFQINRIVLKIKKELWEQVKMERDQSVE